MTDRRVSGLPSDHQVHRRLGGDVLLHGVAERGKVDAFEQGLALAEQDWGHGEVHLVEEPGLQILANGGGSATDPHVLAPGGRACLVQRRLDSFTAFE